MRKNFLGLLLLLAAVVFMLASNPASAQAKVLKVKTANKVKVKKVLVKNTAASSQAKKNAASSTAKSPTNSSAARPEAGAYIELSTYYLLPNQNFTVRGAYFSPNEQVEVMAAGIIKTVTADKQGGFSTDSFNLSMGDVGSKVEVSASGTASKIIRTAELKVGTYYPQVSPDSYYVGTGSRIIFQGNHFAPSEKVVVVSNKKVLTTISADVGGNFSYTTNASNTAGDQVYDFTGAYTQNPVHVKITTGRK